MYISDVKEVFKFLFLGLFCLVVLESCNKQLTQNRVFVSKKAQQRYNKAEEFVQNHFKNYQVPEDVLFEFHVIFFNNNDEFTISKLGSYQSVIEFAADKKLLFEIAENRKESYTGYVMLRNYNLYKEIEILDENDVLFYFPDVIKMGTDTHTKAFYELENFVHNNSDKYAKEGDNLVLLAIPVEEENLQFDKVVHIGGGVSTKEILMSAFEKNKPILEDAIYIELVPGDLLQNYRIVHLYKELQEVKNYLETKKVNADVLSVLENLKQNQRNLSDEFSSINKQLINVNENETILRQMLIQILNKIDY